MAFDNKVINGRDIVLSIDGKDIAFAVSHSISIDTQTIALVSKKHTKWNKFAIATSSWSISIDNLFSLYVGDRLNYLDLEKIMRDKERITVYSIYEGDGGQLIQAGYGYITRVAYAATDGANTSFSISIVGDGELTTQVYT